MSRLHLTIALGAALAALALVAGADRGGDAQATDQRVDPFTEVAFALPGEMTLVQTGEPIVSIQATARQLEAIDVEVVDEVLKIKHKKRSGWRNVDLSDVQVTVGYDTLEGLTVAGSGNALADSIGSELFSLAISGSGSALIQALSCEHAQFKVAGSGDVRIMQLSAETTATKIAGSGNIVLTGNAGEQTLSIAGSGDYKAGDLASSTAQLTIAGSGTATLRASDRISGSVVGSGDLRYYGDPEITVRISGSGSTEKLSDTL